MGKSKDKLSISQKILFNPSKVVKTTFLLAAVFVISVSFLYLAHNCCLKQSTQQKSDSGRYTKESKDDPCGLKRNFRLHNRSEEEKTAFRLFCEYKDLKEALQKSDKLPYYYNGGGDGVYRFVFTMTNPNIIYEVNTLTEEITPRLPYIDKFQIYNSEEPNFIYIDNTNISLPVPKKYKVSSEVSAERNTTVISSSDLTVNVRMCVGNPDWSVPDKMDSELCKYIMKEVKNRGIDYRNLLEDEIYVEIKIYETELDPKEWSEENLYYQGMTLEEVNMERLEEGYDAMGEYMQFGNQSFYTVPRRCCAANDFIYTYNTFDLSGQNIIVEFSSRYGRSVILEDILSTMRDSF